ncbi:hypothetical protein HY487_00325 [Candidatus Woesearchaeota archaeon]|nr:hypothetical protein [Candidatus Woesearchaeota archaeon]
MTIDKKELTKLSPEQRIKKLKLMEEEKKKEFDEIEKLIKDSMQELKIDKIAGEISPEQRTVDISSLFESSEGQKLEKTAKKAKSAGGARGYQAIAQVSYDYTQLKKFDDIISMGYSLTEEQRAVIGKIGERVTADKYSTIGEETASLLDASRATLYKLEKELGLPKKIRSWGG